MKICWQCKEGFEVTNSDRLFLSEVSPVFGGVKFEVPEPMSCPPCRQRQRLAFRNLRSVYMRKCDLTGKPILSTFDKDCATPVYSAEAWWGDSWDGTSFGRDFDFSRSFFEQFAELYHMVPLLQNSVLLTENCDYINGAANCKDCYLCFNMDYCEKCYYITECKHMLSCVDCLSSNHCELCYECVCCESCYNLKYSQRCMSCHDSYFLADCKQCKNCIGCVNLVGKEYYVFNQEVPREQFEAFKLRLQNHEEVEKLKKEFAEFSLRFPKKYYHGYSNENFSGDRIQNIKNSYNCFSVSNLENCKYCYYFFDSKNCMDQDVFGDNAEWMYNCITSGLNSSNNLFCMFTWNSSSYNLYCHAMSGCSNNFGCSGLKRKKYCILNKQYTKEEYEALVPRIIEHMKNTPYTGQAHASACTEWGEFFPPSISLFRYNETQSAEFHPLTKENALALGFRWKNLEEKIPDANRRDVAICEATGRPFKMIAQELKFYSEQKIPLPHFSSEERHRRRNALQNLPRIYDRACAKCSTPIQTSYVPDKPEIVYCENCYLQEIY
ncbi:MAG: hypothetical protein Q8P68_03120 [Candidatus Peregrinibacteria bacterium]|nr:hypothetical protein [Candidatus Peregrinibacteria bacterium]MDZ4244688.1 hypothetical protein [Candidatus Gracilibacteria bacterium]